MNYLIDTHTHLYAEQFEEDRAEVIARAFAQNVQKLFLPNIDLASIEGMLVLEEEYPDQCYAMMGLHPCSVDANYKDALDKMRGWLEKRSFVAIGEIGLDYYWSMEFVQEQKDAFRQQCKWAIELDLPIVIHARDSLDDLIEIVREEKKGGRLRGIFHCFGGSLEQAKAIMDLDFLMGLGGVLTFKKANLGAVVEHIPLEYLVLETDAPYLTPTPYRGKRNESAYVVLVAEKLAEIKGLSVEKVAKITTANALALFGV